MEVNEMDQKATWRTTVCAFLLWCVGKETGFIDKKNQENGTLRRTLAHRCHAFVPKTAEIL